MGELTASRLRAGSTTALPPLMPCPHRPLPRAAAALRRAMSLATPFPSLPRPPPALLSPCSTCGSSAHRRRPSACSCRSRTAARSSDQPPPREMMMMMMMMTMMRRMQKMIIMSMTTDEAGLHAEI